MNSNTRLFAERFAIDQSDTHRSDRNLIFSLIPLNTEHQLTQQAPFSDPSDPFLHKVNLALLALVICALSVSICLAKPQTKNVRARRSYTPLEIDYVVLCTF